MAGNRAWSMNLALYNAMAAEDEPLLTPPVTPDKVAAAETVPNTIKMPIEYACRKCSDLDCPYNNGEIEAAPIEELEEEDEDRCSNCDDPECHYNKKTHIKWSTEDVSIDPADEPTDDQLSIYDYTEHNDLFQGASLMEIDAGSPAVEPATRETPMDTLLSDVDQPAAEFLSERMQENAPALVRSPTHEDSLAATQFLPELQQLTAPAPVRNQIVLPIRIKDSPPTKPPTRIVVVGEWHPVWQAAVDREAAQVQLDKDYLERMWVTKDPGKYLACIDGPFIAHFARMYCADLKKPDVWKHMGTVMDATSFEHLRLMLKVAVKERARANFDKRRMEMQRRMQMPRQTERNDGVGEKKRKREETPEGFKELMPEDVKAEGQEDDQDTTTAEMMEMQMMERWASKKIKLEPEGW